MEKYLAKCHKKLKEWNAPQDNWYCVELIDGEDANFTCELCGYEGVRYIHVMEHDAYFEKLYVGCICAGVMEGDILMAKERDRKMKNRAKRKQNFPRKKWKMSRGGGYYVKYHDKYVFINHTDNGYNCACNGKRTSKYHEKPIDNFLTACYAAFDLADPIEEAMECEKKRLNKNF
ncbi:hypothetical protein Q5O14_08025 [Eubacteriaceae bacterium ES2]|nr:hypothetical protein Q5O14_08025 [Eubacteriaceae bacterium ES2]